MSTTAPYSEQSTDYLNLPWVAFAPEMGTLAAQRGHSGSVLGLPAGINKDDSDPSWGRIEACHTSPLIGAT